MELTFNPRCMYEDGDVYWPIDECLSVQAAWEKLLNRAKSMNKVIDCATLEITSWDDFKANKGGNFCGNIYFFKEESGEWTMCCDDVNFDNEWRWTKWKLGKSGLLK